MVENVRDEDCKLGRLLLAATAGSSPKTRCCRCCTRYCRQRGGMMVMQRLRVNGRQGFEEEVAGLGVLEKLGNVLSWNYYRDKEVKSRQPRKVVMHVILWSPSARPISFTSLEKILGSSHPRNDACRSPHLPIPLETIPCSTQTPIRRTKSQLNLHSA